jgi:arylsulfatase A-like enzyme
LVKKEIRYIETLIIYIFLLSWLLFFDEKASCWAGTEAISGRKRYNVILFCLDTLRYDHLSLSGYHRKTSPNIDRLLAKEGIVFAQAISQASWTLPAAVSLLTSQYVPTHGIDREFKVLPDEAVTLAEVLVLYGYRTAAFTGGFHISHIYGVNQGFEVFYDEKEFGNLEDILPLAWDWLEDNAGHNFFLFIQAYDCHAPFRVPADMEHIYDPDYNGIMDNFIFDHSLGDLIEGHRLTEPLTGKVHHLRKADIEHLIAHYDAAISYMDLQIGEFLRKLDGLRLTDNTIIVFLSTHGEELMDHNGRIFKRKHGDAYEEGIHVPLIMRHPGLKEIQGRTIDQLVQLIDVAPTILDFLDIPASYTMQGKSLLSLIKDEVQGEFYEYTFSGGFNQRDPYEKFPEHMAIRTRQWKLIHIFDPRERKVTFELYNIEDDPGERRNLIKRYPRLSADLKEQLYNWYETSKGSRPEVTIDKALLKEMKEKMREYGYWWIEERGSRWRPAPGKK